MPKFEWLRNCSLKGLLPAKADDFNKKVIMCLIMALGMGLVVSFFVPTEVSEMKTHSSLVWALVWIAYIVMSLRVVGTTERGLLTFFGKPIGNLEPGLHLVPFLFCELITISRNIRQEELPSEPEKIWDQKDSDGKPLPVPPGMVPPVRIIFNIDDPDPKVDKDIHQNGAAPTISRKPKVKKTDPLRRRLTVEAAFTWSFECIDLLIFVRTFGRPEEARRTIGDMVVIEMTNVLQRGTLARAQDNADAINENILRSLLKNILEMKTGTCPTTDSLDELNKELVKFVGIRILKVQFKPFGLSHDLNKQMAAAAAAISAKEAQITASEGKEQEMLNIAVGTKAGLDATTEAMRKRAEVAETPGGRLALQLETLEKTVGDKAQIIFTGGGGNGQGVLETLTGALLVSDEVRGKKADEKPAEPKP